VTGVVGDEEVVGGEGGEGEDARGIA